MYGDHFSQSLGEGDGNLLHRIEIAKENITSTLSNDIRLILLGVFKIGLSKRPNGIIYCFNDPLRLVSLA